MARTMMITSKITNQFWADAINTACYTINQCMSRPLLEKTSYELLKGRKPNISHLRVFGCKCFIHNNEKNLLEKFDDRSDKWIFLGYSTDSKSYRVLKKRTMCVEESVHVIFDGSNTISREDVLASEASAEEHTASEQEQVQETGSSNSEKQRRYWNS